MIFNEIYSVYYNVIAKIIERILQGDVTEKELNEIVIQNAFGESTLTILPSLKSEKWQLIKNMATPIKNKPTMPLTTIQKRWLKAISQDPRINLFGIKIEGLEDVEPLFTKDDYFVYDKYSDGDPYESEEYISHFKTVLSAIKEKQPLKIKMVNRKNAPSTMTVLPHHLEYSEKDDKFRIITTNNKTINVARIVSCEKSPVGKNFPDSVKPLEKRELTLRLCDKRNALERCLLHFAHFEKRAERIDKYNYNIHIKYDKEDEQEMLIRILSFGPMVEVIEPRRFRNLIIERLQKQKNCELF